MKLYRAKIPVIAKEVVDRLAGDGDIEVLAERREEAEKDLSAIMEEYLRRDMELRDRLRDYMATRKIPFSEFGRTRKQVAEEQGHPVGDDVERFLTRQFIENMLISPNVEEVFEEDQVIHKKVMEVLRGNDVDEREIREEAATKVKNVREGTVDYEIALQSAVRAVKKRRGLIEDQAVSLVVLVALGCGPQPAPDEVPPPPPAVPAPAPVAPAPITVVPGSGGDAVAVQLQYHGVSPLYRGYFATQEWVSTLGAGLGGCLDDAASLAISYDSENRIGRILVSTTASELACAPRIDGDHVDLTPLIPLGTALAAYRDTIAAERDIRIASFRSGVRLLHGTDLCEIYIGGQFPPDGSTFSPCVTLVGSESCLGDRNDPITTLPLTGEVGAALRRCLQ